MRAVLDAEMAGQMARIALSHVTREFPNKLDHVMMRAQDAQTPRALHPLFFGSFDWHSCVHSYWLLATLFRLFPHNPESEAIRTLFDESLTVEKVAGECAYLARPTSRAFERPYGWAWLLMLQTELLRHSNGTNWDQNLRPLADAIVERFREWLPRATYPVRVGTHGNTAFALRLAFDYAQTVQDAAFLDLLRSTAGRWYTDDRDDPCREPSGEDFLSPSLTEAQCMARALPPDGFRGWFGRFLPRLAQREPVCLFQPAQVSDRSDGRILHLDGLNLSRAWSWFEIASWPGTDEPLRRIAVDTAERHLAWAMTTISGDYMGAHWLATYALLALLTVQEPSTN
jgi:hypothetical protein